MILQELLLPDGADAVARQLVDQIMAGDLDAKYVYTDWLLDHGLIVDDAPHHGWAGMYPLSQDETDDLIKAELYILNSLEFGSAPVPRLDALLGQPKLRILHHNGWTHAVRKQRGGIDSDPLIRYIARRAWSKRDEDERAIRVILESYRVEIGLQPWEQFQSWANGRGRPGDISQLRCTGRTTHGILHAIAECVYRKQDTLYIVARRSYVDIGSTCRMIVAGLTGKDIATEVIDLNYPVKFRFISDMRKREGIYYQDHSLEPHIYRSPADLVYQMAKAGVVSTEEANQLMEYPDVRF